MQAGMWDAGRDVGWDARRGAGQGLTQCSDATSVGTYCEPRWLLSACSKVCISNWASCDCCRRVLSVASALKDSECRMQDAGCRMQDSECRMQDAGCRMQDAGGRMQDAGCRMLLPSESSE